MWTYLFVASVIVASEGRRSSRETFSNLTNDGRVQARYKPSLIQLPWIKIEGDLNVTKEESNFIFNGVNANAGFQPWMASLQIFDKGEWSHICGASLIRQNKILTAAHCVSTWGSDVDNGIVELRIGLGFMDLKKNLKNCETCQLISVTRVQIHEEYYEGSIGVVPLNDIAILTLGSDAEINAHVRPIQPAESAHDFEDEVCSLTGWGRTEKGKTAKLKRMYAQVISNGMCRHFWKVAETRLFKTELCTLDWQEQSSSCAGDSGGPLVCGNEQAGIVSWGLSSCNGCFPSVFTRVTKYRKWIKNTLNN